MVDDIVFDLSSYKIRTPGTGLAAVLTIYLDVVTDRPMPVTCYIDDVIITQNEP